MARLFKEGPLHRREKGGREEFLSLRGGKGTRPSRPAQRFSNACHRNFDDDASASSFAEPFPLAFRFDRAREVIEHGRENLLSAESKLKGAAFASKDFAMGNSIRDDAPCGPEGRGKTATAARWHPLGFLGPGSLFLRSSFERIEGTRRVLARRYWRLIREGREYEPSGD